MNLFDSLARRAPDPPDLSRLPVATSPPPPHPAGTASEWMAAYKRDPEAVIAVMAAAAPGGEARWGTFFAGQDQRTVKAMLKAAFPPKPEKKIEEE